MHKIRRQFKHNLRKVKNSAFKINKKYPRNSFKAKIIKLSQLLKLIFTWYNVPSRPIESLFQVSVPKRRARRAASSKDIIFLIFLAITNPLF